MSDLTAKQKLFVSEYLLDANGTKAAIRAGYNPKNAVVISSQNLRKLNVAAAIQKAQEERSLKTGISAEYVLTTLKKTTDAAIADNDRPSIFKGCELLGRHFKLYTDKIEQSGTVSHEITIVEERRRLAGLS
jgi:phage terminase small subunit